MSATEQPWLRLSNVVPGFDYRKVGFHVVIVNDASLTGYSSRVNEKGALVAISERTKHGQTTKVFSEARSPGYGIVEVRGEVTL